MGADLVDKELVPEIIKGVRNGYLNLDALDDGVICSSFASLIARKVTTIMSNSSHDPSRSKEMHRGYIEILMSSLEKTMSDHAVGKAISPEFVNSHPQQKLQLKPISRQWASELKVFLKLHSVRLD
jgi:hypothetical protein